MTASTWSIATVVPGDTSNSVTVPACGAEMTAVSYTHLTLPTKA